MVVNVEPESTPYSVALKEATPYTKGGDPLTDYDVVVVGAGLVGSSSAFWLSRKGAKTCLIEQYADGLSKGASLGGPRRIGILDLAPGVRVRKAWDMFLEINKEAKEGEKLLDVTGECMVVNIWPVGWLLMIFFFLWMFFRYLSNHALPAGLKLLFVKPMVAAYLPNSIKVTWNNFGVYYPEAASIYPRRCLQFFQEGAKASGAECRFNTTVKDVKVEGGKVLVETECEGRTQTISCSQCVLAAAGWSGPLLQKMGHTKAATEIHTFSCPIYPCKLQDMSVEAGCPIFAFPFAGIYGFPTNTAFPNRIDIRTSAPDHYGQDPLYKETGEGPNLKTIDAFLEKYIPDQPRKTVSVAACHYPRLAVKGDAFKPVIDRVPGTDGRVILAAGFDGYGFKYGPLYGLEVLDLIAGKPGPAGLEWDRQEAENFILRKLHMAMDSVLKVSGDHKKKEEANGHAAPNGKPLQEPLLKKDLENGKH